jgi:hypothetical protein
MYSWRGNLSFSQWFLFFPSMSQPLDPATYLEQIAQLDPPLYLARLKAEELLFQFAKHDQYIPVNNAMHSSGPRTPDTVCFSMMRYTV